MEKFDIVGLFETADKRIDEQEKKERIYEQQRRIQEQEANVSRRKIERQRLIRMKETTEKYATSMLGLISLILADTRTKKGKVEKYFDKFQDIGRLCNQSEKVYCVLKSLKTESVYNIDNEGLTIILNYSTEHSDVCHEDNGLRDIDWEYLESIFASYNISINRQQDEYVGNMFDENGEIIIISVSRKPIIADTINDAHLTLGKK